MSPGAAFILGTIVGAAIGIIIAVLLVTAKQGNQPAQSDGRLDRMLDEPIGGIDKRA